MQTEKALSVQRAHTEKAARESMNKSFDWAFLANLGSDPDKYGSLVSICEWLASRSQGLDRTRWLVPKRYVFYSHNRADLNEEAYIAQQAILIGDPDALVVRMPFSEGMWLRLKNLKLEGA